MEVEKVEFEHDAPKELLIEDEPTVNEQLNNAFNEKPKKEHKPLKLIKKQKDPRKFKAKDYIEIFCVICEKKLIHAKKDNEGNFYPYALCQHVIFKGVHAEK